MDRYEKATSHAELIERELRRLGQWQAEPMPDSAYESHQAFYADTMTYFQWLQFVLLERIQEIVAERGTFPGESSTGAYAVRYFDGFDDAGDLIRILSEFDEFCERSARKPARERVFVPVPLIVREPAPPLPVVPPESPRVITERFWRTRDVALLTAHPSPRAAYDTELAESVFNTATGFVEIAGEPEEISSGVIVRTVIEAQRGAWVVLTALANDKSGWRVDLPKSIEQTTQMFLRMHRTRSPYTEVEDARGQAMLFWEQVLHRNERWARELCVPESGDIPQFGEGQMDEFIWYVAHAVDGPKATVRILMNTHAECRTLITHMVQREGKWLVDLPATLGA